MSTIGLIAAMPQESAALLRLTSALHLPGAMHLRSALHLRAHTFALSGQACLLVTSGVGVRRAAEAARALLEAASLSVLVSFGIAGAVQADLAIGDVVAAESFCRLDQEALSPVQSLSPWPEAARAAAAQALAERAARLVIGTAITTGGSQVKQGRLGEMPHPVLEMETAGIAAVAAEKGIPLLSLRAISDGPRSPIPFDLGTVMDADGNFAWPRS